LELASGDSRSADCSSDPGGADRQADQCRFSKRGFDPACEHHDARTRRGYGVDITFVHAAGKCANAVGAADGIGIANRGGGQETAGAKTRPVADPCHVPGAISAGRRFHQLIFAGVAVLTIA
jgi:hypothetical protein